MTTSIPREVENALSSFRSIARRINIAEIVPPIRFENLTEVESFLQKAAKILLQEREKSERRLAEIQQVLNNTSADDLRVWQEVDKACAKMEDLLRNPPTMKLRLDEGRRSLAANINKSLNNMLEAVVREEGTGDGEIIAEITPESLQKIEESLPSWALAWSEYSFYWVHSDLNRQIEVLWTPREGDLPFQPPQLQKFALPNLQQISSTFHVSNLQLRKPKTGVLGGMYRHFRTILYGVMSVGFMFGFSRSSGDKEGFGMYSVVMILAALVAVTYGYFQSIADKETEKEKLREELLKKSERMLTDAIRYWFDRAGDKMTEYLREIAHQQRQDFVKWYRQTILPAKIDMETRNEQRHIEQKKAQSEKMPLERKCEDLKQALDGLKKVQQAIKA